MTYEEFKQLAEHPQHRDVPAIFKLEVLETEELKEKKRSHYPKYKVNTYCPQAFTTTLEKERMMAQHNAQISNFNLNNDLQQDMLKKQSELNLDAMGRKQELDLGGQEELQRMNLENQRETMRIQDRKSVV